MRTVRSSGESHVGWLRGLITKDGLELLILLSPPPQDWLSKFP